MYRKVQFFFLSSLFFISVVYNESLYYCNSCILEQISYLGKFWFLRYDPKRSYLGKFWFLRYGPKRSWPIRLQDISINRRTVKLAVTHKEINEINWFLVCLSNSFLRNGLFFYLIFGTMVGNSNSEKPTEPFIPGKFIFGPNLGKRLQNGPKIVFLGYFEKFCDVSFSWK